MTRTDLIRWLEETDPEKLESLYRDAYRVKLEQVGAKVYFRGIIEFSNVCTKDCFYCGIRRGNHNTPRYTLSDEEVVDTARWAWEAEYGSIVLQSGERSDRGFVDTIERLLHRIHETCRGELGVTLSLGEQSPDTYRRWRAAGAKRYLLRIETSNRALYGRLHPDDHSFDARLRALDDLRALDYQVGTGVMIGLPGQTAADLADDLLFFRDHDIDMIGMGPYIPHKDTPLAAEATDFEPGRALQQGLTMIALTRLLLRDVNIAATTALQALDPVGRERGLRAGANIIMPNLTAVEYREAYQLYDGKPCLDEDAKKCRLCLQARIASLGEEIGFNEQGDSPHFLQRHQEQAGRA